MDNKFYALKDPQDGTIFATGNPQQIMEYLFQVIQRADSPYTLAQVDKNSLGYIRAIIHQRYPEKEPIHKGARRSEEQLRLMVEDYADNRYQMETGGDIEDLKTLLINSNDDEVADFLKFNEFLSGCPGVISAAELEGLEVPSHYRHKYPNLYKTMLIWAWG